MARFDILLKGKLTQSELKKLRTSLDILGEIAIVEIPPELSKKSSVIGRAVLKANPQLRAVFKKATPVRGEFRVRKLERIAGKGGTLTTYRENNCSFQFDMAKVFFTPRMSSERLRVAKQVKKGEIVVDMFAGVGPFAILIAKTQPKVKVCAIDSNPEAIKYLLKSAAMNKVSHKITAYIGDARVAIEAYSNGIASRVIMNLPLTEENFFPSALKALRGKGVLHFYTFAKKELDVRKKIMKSLQKRAKFKILKIRKVRQYAPRIWNFVADIKIRKVI